MVDWYLHTLIYEFKKKKWCCLRTVFLTSGYRNLEVRHIFVNMSTKTKIFSKIFLDVDLGPRYY